MGDSFGELLRRFRARAGLNVSELAEAVGASRTSIAEWERDKRVPRDRARLKDLAKVLDLSESETAELIAAARRHRQVNSAGALAAAPQTEGVAGTSTPAPASPRHQLRTPLPDFVGQEAAVAILLDVMRKTSADGKAAAISGVRGMGGIGKTELAYLVANHLIDSFSDAQIVVALRGTSTTPLTPEQAVRAVIHALTPDAKLPDDLPALEQHYRTALHGQRMLILADDAHDAAQVRPLLPPAGCALLVTSRVRFSLHGMTTIDLEVLDEAEAVRLLRGLCRRLGDADARELARACGYLPLALRISGSLLHNDPALDLPTYLARLADQQHRLSQLRDPDDAHLDVAATLALSYSQLDASMQQVFRQLGVMVADFSTELAQAVVAVGEGVDVRTMLHGLLRRNLVLYDRARERWRLHDLVRDVAVQQLEAAGDVEAARWRYAQAAVALAAQMHEQYRAGGAGVELALAAFDAERPHIDAAIRWAQCHAETPAGDQLLLDAALATRDIGFIRYDPRQERILLWDGARTAACRLGDRLGEGSALTHLGNAYYDLGEPQTAITYYEQVLAIARELGYRRGEGSTLGNLGVAYAELGELQTAITYFEQDLAIACDLPDRAGEGITLGNIGRAYHALGEPQTAITYYEQGLAIARDLGDRYIEGSTLGNLGNAYTGLGDSGRAITMCEQALAIAHEIGGQRTESYALSYLARAQAHQGEIAQAMTTFAQALVLFHERGDRRGEAECHWQFGLALVQQGEREQALPLLQAALAYEQEIGHAKAQEHATVLARLEAGEELPPELRILPSQRAIGGDSVQPAGDDAQP
jgi:tetratricopeptide (TPR) repeat protein/transcriptional regulator with XRE-family HTH domain